VHIEVFDLLSKGIRKLATIVNHPNTLTALDLVWSNCVDSTRLVVKANEYKNASSESINGFLFLV